MGTKSQFPDETSDEGEFARQEDAFRAWVSDDGSTPFPVESGRYHLYVSLACPWAHRSLIVRNLKGLQQAIGVTVVVLPWLILFETNAAGLSARERVMVRIRSTGFSSLVKPTTFPGQDIAAA
jgi:glutathionyl-hydroquinone reductase